jgi:hypothetical protein
VTRDEAYAWYAGILLDRIRTDRYPSADQMDLLEAALPAAPHLAPEFVEVLMNKVSDDRWPSIRMLERIRRVAAQLPG